MDLTNELLTDITHYLDGTMPDSERREFTARLEKEEDLRLEVTLQHEIREGMQLLAEKERFKAIHAEVIGAVPPPVQRPVKRLRWQPLAVAASLFLLAGVGWWWWSGSGASSDPYLAAELKPEPVYTPDPDRLGAAPERHTADSLALAGALNVLHKKGTEAAIPMLEKVAARPLNHWTASAEWYLALSYRKEGRQADARRLFERISDTEGHPYQTEAARELRQ